ncbi:hypothetical protein EJD96_15815 [Herbaspirillum seropedicae]|uniref:hypothetical protein n=1 Tax=Herbaspirillum seropedicae TaxID=964 RepID=UPI00112374A0|nr:hypothetical protein [Herbaspirillum seropedicae]QDD65521.1 hypothetical protein EJD96_15815 [Herbaspirillum seropedicae]
MTHAASVSELRDRITEVVDAKGVLTAKEIESQSKLLLHWARFLTANYLTGTADELIGALNSAIRETAACCSLGLVRPALFAMRGQVDLVLSWIYFRDHPREYELLLRTGDEFKLKTEVLEYSKKHFDNFGNRFGILKQIKKRKEDDPYRLLSAHVHAQHARVLPNIGSLKDVIQDTLTDECMQVQFEVSEYLSDILFSIFGVNFHTIPEEITSQINARLKTPEQRAEFYGSQPK